MRKTSPMLLDGGAAVGSFPVLLGDGVEPDGVAEAVAEALQPDQARLAVVRRPRRWRRRGRAAPRAPWRRRPGTAGGSRVALEQGAEEQRVAAPRILVDRAVDGVVEEVGVAALEAVPHLGEEQPGQGDEREHRGAAVVDQQHDLDAVEEGAAEDEVDLAAVPARSDRWWRPGRAGRAGRTAPSFFSDGQGLGQVRAAQGRGRPSSRRSAARRSP